MPPTSTLDLSFCQGRGAGRREEEGRGQGQLQMHPLTPALLSRPLRCSPKSGGGEAAGTQMPPQAGGAGTWPQVPPRPSMVPVGQWPELAAGQESCEVAGVGVGRRTGRGTPPPLSFAAL